MKTIFKTKSNITLMFLMFEKNSKNINFEILTFLILSFLN